MNNIKETNEYKNAIANYENNIRLYLQKDYFAPSKDELAAISKTLSFFGMTTTDEHELIRKVRIELGLSTRKA